MIRGDVVIVATRGEYIGSLGSPSSKCVDSYNPGMVPVPADLPGADLVAQGLEDLARGEETLASLLVAIGAPRLRQLGLTVPGAPAQPEHRLYALLAREDSDSAHGRYNALIRRLVSFERALGCAT